MPQQHPKSSVVQKILDLPINKRETVLDKLFQGFFKLLEISALFLDKMSQKK
jgi:DNA polymerase sigma